MKCPNCGASNRKDNKFCKKCGEELNPTLEEIVSDVVEEKEDSKKSSKKKTDAKNLPPELFPVRVLCRQSFLLLSLIIHIRLSCQKIFCY